MGPADLGARGLGLMRAVARPASGGKAPWRCLPAGAPLPVASWHCARDHAMVIAPCMKRLEPRLIRQQTVA